MDKCLLYGATLDYVPLAVSLAVLGMFCKYANPVLPTSFVAFDGELRMERKENSICKDYTVFDL